MSNDDFDPSELQDGDVVILPLPDDDPVLSDREPGSKYTDDDHDFVFATRWDTERGRMKMVWGHKPQRRPGENAPYTRVYSRILKCRTCGIETSSTTNAKCREWRGECNHCGADIDPDASNFGACDDCRAPLPTGTESMTAKAFYRDLRESYMKAKGEL